MPKKPKRTRSRQRMTPTGAPGALPGDDEPIDPKWRSAVMHKVQVNSPGADVGEGLREQLRRIEALQDGDPDKRERAIRRAVIATFQDLQDAWGTVYSLQRSRAKAARDMNPCPRCEEVDELLSQILYRLWPVNPMDVNKMPAPETKCPRCAYITGVAEAGALVASALMLARNAELHVVQGLHNFTRKRVGRKEGSTKPYSAASIVDAVCKGDVSDEPYGLQEAMLPYRDRLLEIDDEKAVYLHLENEDRDPITELTEERPAQVHVLVDFGGDPVRTHSWASILNRYAEHKKGARRRKRKRRRG